MDGRKEERKGGLEALVYDGRLDDPQGRSSGRVGWPGRVSLASPPRVRVVAKSSCALGWLRGWSLSPGYFHSLLDRVVWDIRIDIDSWCSGRRERIRR